MKFSGIILLAVLQVLQIHCIQQIIMIRIKIASGGGSQRGADFLCVGTSGHTADGMQFLKVNDADIYKPDSKTGKLSGWINECIEKSLKTNSGTTVEVYYSVRSNLNTSWRVIHQIVSVKSSSILPFHFLETDSIICFGSSDKDVQLKDPQPDVHHIEAKLTDPKSSTMNVKILHRGHECMKLQTIFQTGVDGFTIEGNQTNTAMLQVPWSDMGLDFQANFNESKLQKNIFIAPYGLSEKQDNTIWYGVSPYNIFVNDTGLNFEFSINSQLVKLQITLLSQRGSMIVQVPAVLAADTISILTTNSPNAIASAAFVFDSAWKDSWKNTWKPTWAECLLGFNGWNLAELEIVGINHQRIGIQPGSIQTKANNTSDSFDVEFKFHIEKNENERN